MINLIKSYHKKDTSFHFKKRSSFHFKNRHSAARPWNLILLLSLNLLVLHITLCAQETQWTTDNAYPHLKFNQPVDVHVMPGTNQLCIVEKKGRIQLIEDKKDIKETTVLLDITDRVGIRFNEMGLLGLAFHPHFQNNGYFFVNYTALNPQRTVISRFQINPNNQTQTLKESEKIFLEIKQPYVNHNGGGIVFGPDGHLYIGMGDGGSGGDPKGHGQNRKTLLGAMLRIDVNQSAHGLPYSIPQDNPFYADTTGLKKEIYAWGLRNPWRFSFDQKTGDLWTGDVGQNKFEEIDIIRKGKNYGWNIKEGFIFFKKRKGNSKNLEDPVHVYGRKQGVSITGGLVLYDPRLPDLKGHYLFADFGSGNIWALKKENNFWKKTLLIKSRHSISSFSLDTQGHLLIVDFLGRLYRLKKINS